MHEIKTIIKPILEEMGLYNGNDVSAKDLFDKYLNSFPNGIKIFWKFEIIVKYEFNLFVKAVLFEGSEEIYILSLEPPKKPVFSNNYYRKILLMPSYIGKFYSIDDDESLVGSWLYVYESYYNECEDQNNKLYLYRSQHEKIARYWLQHGKHAPAYKSPIVLRGQKIWDQFIKKYVCWKSEIDWIGISPKNKIDIKYSVRRWL